MARKILVCGGGGFIGHHLVRRLRADGDSVWAADLVRSPFDAAGGEGFWQGDLRDAGFVRQCLARGFDEIYQLAADMGGAGYVFTGAHDAAIMHNSATINLNILEAARAGGCGRIFFASSACVYPDLAAGSAPTACREADAYPAMPDSDYGWEKLFAERLYAAYARNHGISVRIARYHNIFGPEGDWQGGREKAPAALCRKVAAAQSGDAVDIWGDGTQQRSFLYIDECIEGTIRLMRSDVEGPVNIGSDQMVTIDDLVDLIAQVAGKDIVKRHVAGPVGVQARCSDNSEIARKLGWQPSGELAAGMAATYRWIAAQIAATAQRAA